MATFYVSVTGNNGNDGSISSPWRNPYYACNTVTSPGNTIHINSGTYNESQRCNLYPGVNLRGTAEATTIINFTYAVNDFDSGCIRLYSTSLNNAANQSISELTITGTNWTAYNAITVYNRGNVTIDNCRIKNFIANGVVYSGPTAILTTPAENNELYNCYITDCSKRASGTGYGSIMIRGQKNLSIHGNVLSNTLRASGSNGNLVNAVRGGYEALQFYNNHCTKPNYDGGEWNFHMEIWSNRGGNKVYNNQFYGGECIIDISSPASSTAGHFKTTYDYSWWITDNLFDNVIKQSTPETNNNRFCVLMEDCNVKDVWITHNRFTKVPTPMAIAMGTADYGPYENIYMLYNIFEDVGYTDNNSIGCCLYIKSYGSNAAYNNLRLQQNVIIAGPTGKASAAVRFYLSGTVNGLNISNNIILNSNVAWLVTSSGTTKGTINTLVVRNNIFYNNANGNALSDATTMIAAGTYVTSGNIIDNPDFVSASDFHFPLGSPGIDAGYDLNILAPDGSAFYDYDLLPIDATTPNIGVYEAGTSPNPPDPPDPPVVPVTSVTVTAEGGSTTINVDHGTLQMYATVLPANATDTSVVWSVINGTGSASISLTGLLTAITSGTVTVKATSNG